MNPGKSVGIGIIGCGTIACGTHLPGLARLRNARVAGLADPDPRALERARRLIDAPVFATVDDLLAHDAIDAVIISSPSALHAGQVQAACAASKHIYVEKPLAHDAESLASIRSSIEDSTLVIAVGYNFRFHPACRVLRQRLAAGSIGSIRAIVSDFTEPFDALHGPAWKRERALGGGVLLDLASHHIDLYRWLLQDELAWISSDIRSLFFEQDSAYLRAGTRSGVELSGYFALTGGRSHGITIHGSAAVLRLDFHSGQITEDRIRPYGYGIRRRGISGGLEHLGWRARKLLRPSYNPSHGLALRAFVAAIANPAQGTAELATAADGMAVLQAVLNAEAGAGSAASQQPVRPAGP